MGQFSIEMKGSGSGIVVMQLIGALEREKCGLLTVEIQPSDALIVDLSHLTALSSEGAREFRAWSSRLVNAEITFVHCPKFFIDQVNAIAHFIPEHAKVESFYVPYSSSKSGEEEWVLFEKNFAFATVEGQLEITPPAVRDSHGNFMSLDVEASKYFQFLSKHA